MPTRTTDHPFNPRPLPGDDARTRELLQRFVQGRLSAQEQHALEQAAEADPFLREALDGLAMPGAAAALPRLEKARPGGTHAGWWVAGGLALLGLVALTFLRSDPSGPGGPETRSGEVAAAVLTPVRPEEHARLDSELVTAVPPVALAEVAHVPERYERPAATTPVEEEPAMQGDPERTPVQVPETLKPYPVIAVPVVPKEEAPQPKGTVVVHKLIARHGLKLVSPEELYAWDPLVVMDLNAVPANYPDRHARREAEEQGPTMRYVDFMDRALGKYAAGDARGCLEEALFLLDQYPDDVNALFYAGLSAYDLGLYGRAERYLGRAAVHKVNSFNEEAAWFKALAVDAAGRSEEARPLFARIAEEGGFYSERAKAELGR